MILRNPQALYVLRNLEKFESSVKIHFFILEIAANFNDFLGSSTSTPIDLMLHMHLPLLKALKLH